MKKLLAALGVIIILATAVYFFVGTESFSTFENAETNFGYKKTDRITKVVITEPDGWKIKLEKQKEGYWIVNDFYLAREDALELIFETFRKIKVDKPMPLAAQENLNQDINNKGKLIEVFTSGEEPTRAFKIYGSGNNRQGTFMKMIDSQTPYLVHIPGFIGSMDIRFHTVLEKWRSHKIFAGATNEIKQLKVLFSETPEDSYTININGKKYEVNNGNGKVIASDNLNENKVKHIIESLPQINIESFDNMYLHKDSLLQMKPFGKIEIISKFPSQSQTLVVYNMPLTKKSKIGSDEKSQIFDQDRFYATINKNEDLVIIQKYVFEEILSKYSDFVLPVSND